MSFCRSLFLLVAMLFSAVTAKSDATRFLGVDFGPAVVAFERLYDLFGYVMLANKSVLKRFEAKPQSKIFAECQNTACKRKVSFAGLTGAISGKGVKDLIDQVDSYDAVKKLLEESVQIMADGSVEQVKAFMRRAIDQQWLTCAECQGIAWDVKMPTDSIVIVSDATRGIQTELEKTYENVGRVLTLFKICFVDNKDIMGALEKKNQGKVFAECCNVACKERMTLDRFLPTITGKGFRDLMDNVDSYDAIKQLIDETIRVATNGSVEQVRTFMSDVVKLPWFTCLRCKGSVWEVH